MMCRMVEKHGPSDTYTDDTHCDYYINCSEVMHRLLARHDYFFVAQHVTKSFFIIFLNALISIICCMMSVNEYKDNNDQ